MNRSLLYAYVFLERARLFWMPQLGSRPVAPFFFGAPLELELVISPHFKTHMDFYWQASRWTSTYSFGKPFARQIETYAASGPFL